MATKIIFMEEDCYLNLDQLSSCKLFERIPAEELPKALQSLAAYKKKYRAGESVYTPGAKALLPGLVLEGAIHIHQIFPDGSTLFLRTVKKGELFGFSMTLGLDENIYADCSVDSEILFMHLRPRNDGDNRDNKHRLIILENLVYILARNNIILNKKIQILSRTSLRQKLVLFLSQQESLQKKKEVELGMTREEIAQYINADRSAVSRELNRMQKDGLIKIKNKSVLIINLRDN